MAKTCPVASCRRWVENVVIGLMLCPWARPAYETGRVRFALSSSTTREGVYLSLLAELEKLASGLPPQVPETTILVTPNAFADDFLEL